MQVLNIFHVLIAIAMIAFILIQKGAGATAGAAFGSGASGTVFGSRGAGNFLSRSTWVLATLFCLISLSMAVMASRLGTAPDADLGVVATVPASGQANKEQSAADLPTTAAPPTVESAKPSDVPSLDTTISQPAANKAGDLPAIEPAANAADKTKATDDGGS